MRKFLVLMTACLLISINASAGESQTLPPYLYYYSDMLNSFVIERADGTDSRLFGAGMMPEYTNNVDGPGWSPSGKWFAWTNTNRDWMGNGAYSIHILKVDRDETRTFELITETIWDISWSPTEDKLTVMEWYGGYQYDYEEHFEYMPMRFYLLDVERDEKITEFFINPRIDGPTQMFWSHDGKFVAFAYDYPSFFKSDSSLRFVSSDGEIVERSIDEAIDYGVIYNRFLKPDFMWSPSGWIGYINPKNKLILENLTYGEAIEVEISGYVIDISWSPTRDEVLIYKRVCTTNPECGYSLDLFSINTRTLSSLDIEFSDLNFYSASDDFWSPNGQMIALQDPEGRIYLITLPSRKIRRLPFSNHDRVWPPLQWVNNGNTLILPLIHHFTIDYPNQRAYRVLRYDTFTHQFDIFDDVSSLSASSDGRYLASDGIYDTITQKITPIPYSRGSSTDNLADEIRWHYRQDWLIRFAQVASKSYRHTSVIRADGTGYRELSRCYFTEVCANWLPPQVNVDDLPPGQPNSVLQAPESVLTYDEWDAIGWGFDEPNLTFTRDCDYESRTFIVNDTLTDQTQQFEIGCGDLTNNGADFSPDRRFFAAGASYKPIYVWDFETGELLTKLNSYAFKLAFSPDGTRLAAQLNGDTVLIWNVSDVVEAAQDE